MHPTNSQERLQKIQNFILFIEYCEIFMHNGIVTETFRADILMSVNVGSTACKN